VSALKTRLFHAIVLGGAALGASALGGCASADDADAGAEGSGPSGRCRTPEGGCDERCLTMPERGCHDPCFVDSDECAVDCVQVDGSCGWPPTK
jgi:hypothetical protein